MKYLSLFLLATGISVSTQAKIWRVNNNAGVAADFVNFRDAAEHATVGAGDTLYFEPSATAYFTNGFTLNKKLVIIGGGYLLDPTDAVFPGNPGLQATTLTPTLSSFTIGNGASGTKISGIVSQSVSFSNTNDVTIERVIFYNAGFTISVGTSTNITIRKCLFYSTNFNQNSGSSASGIVCENNLFTGSTITLSGLTGSNNIFRNNSFSANSGITLVKGYFVNNIVGLANQSTFTDCTIKNNIFQVNQALPGTAVDNKVSQPMANVYEMTGSYDGKFKLKAGSPAIGAGLTVGAVVSPDCGAFGGPDPYVLSGIPAIPTIYSFTAPTSIPSGTPTMNITFSTRNHN